MTSVALLTPPATGFMAARRRWPNQKPDQWQSENNITKHSSPSPSSSSDSEMPESSSNSATHKSSKKSNSPNKPKKHSITSDGPYNVSISPNPIKQEKVSGFRDHSNDSEQRHDLRSYSPSTSPALASSSPSGAKSQKSSNSRLSPSASPRSPQQLNTLRTPSTSLPTSTPPHPSFTPPKNLNAACFNPVMGGLGSAIGGLGPMGLFNGAPQGVVAEGVRNLAAATMPRNCSDLIRSMAAKYNNPNNNNNKGSMSTFFNGQPLNGLHRSQISPVAFPHASFGPAIQADVGSPQSPLAKDLDTKTLTDNSKRLNSTLPTLHPPPGGLPPPPPHHLIPPGAFPNLMDISSTQVLLNMVRNATTMHQTAIGKPIADSTQQHIQKRILYHHQQLQQQQETLGLKQTKPDKISETEERIDPQIHSPSPERGISMKRPADASSPLDLSSSVPSKYSRTSDYSDGSRTPSRYHSVHEDRLPSPHRNSCSDSSVGHNDSSLGSSMPPVDEKKSFLEWSVNEVYEFVKSIDICAEYAEIFREQRIDGACLSLLSESHLTGSLKMKLGPALKLRSFLAAKSNQHSNNTSCYPVLSPTGSCNHCTVYSNNNTTSYNLNKTPFHSDSPASENNNVVSSPGSRSSSKCYSPPHRKENGASPIENRTPPSSSP